MVNELTADRRVRSRYQIWLFTYNTGNPIAYSGAQLREALTDAVEQLDPEGSDPALRRMVVAGHSQGGLLTKLTVVHSGNHFWQRISDVPIGELELEPDTRALLTRSLFVEPVPSVKSVVFIATPHRGSFLAQYRLGRFVSYFVTRPSAVVKGVRDLVDRNADRILLRSLEEVPSSIDNMNPSNPFVEALADLPIEPGVDAHSIIPVLREPLDAGDDGVVKYRSAHLPDVPEKVVLGSGHSTQSHPETIAEMRRILLEHAP
jgi:pimeloyl-ACP methyl ester carboxylesterase